MVTVVEEVAEANGNDMKPEQKAVVETAVTPEELESGTTSDVVTDSGTRSQRDQWVEIGKQTSEGQKTAYEAATMIHLALALGSPELQNHVERD